MKSAQTMRIENFKYQVKTIVLKSARKPVTFFLTFIYKIRQILRLLILQANVFN